MKSVRLVPDYEPTRSGRRPFWVRNLYVIGIALLLFGALYAKVMAESASELGFCIGMVVQLIGLGLVVVWIVQQARARWTR